jgi:HAMP domain-containing protein
MADVTEIEALKASLRGARATADRLTDLAAKVEAIDPRGDVPAVDLDELQRLTLANAIAAQALRGLVETMLRRRGKVADEAPAESGSAGVEE